jgi:hypothetical protein
MRCCAVAPSEYTSAAYEHGCARLISGAMNSSVPVTLRSFSVVAMPTLT